MNFLEDFALGVASSWVASQIDRLSVKLPIVRGSLLIHKRELREKLNSMPFIYRDLKGELLSDFVDVDIATLDSETLAKRSARKIDIASEQRLMQRKKALFLGSAGIGKTTFFRYTILSRLLKRSLPFFYEEEDFIPIYVPLKAVDNTSQNPIVRHILRMTSFLGRSGVKKLIGLMNRGRIMFFLDGYDEIPFAGARGAENYVRSELMLMMAGPGRGYDVKTEYEAFFSAVRNCRVWLSSRQEFFEQNTIIPSDKRREFDQDVVAISIEGVGNNRVRLAKNIFDKYRHRSEVYEEILSEEFFMLEIDSSVDSELRALSFNPLFLTVMCYTYVQKAYSKGTHEAFIAENLVDLILECVNLLIFDLDKGKARDMPAAARAGLLRRRNEFREQKLEFIGFLAATLFLEQKNYFNEVYLREQALRLFSSREDDVSSRIMRGLESASSSMPDFVDQLIYSGVFVTVDRSLVGGVLYDFPHRRFKEVLALIYFDQPVNLDLLIDNVSLRHLNELIIFFFSRSKFQDEALETLLLASRNQSDLYFGNLALKCLENKPDNYRPSPALRRFFLGVIEGNHYFTAPDGLLLFCDQDEDFLNLIISGLRGALESGKGNSLAVACALLLRYDKNLLKEILGRIFAAQLPYDGLSPCLLYYGLVCIPERIASNCLSWIRQEKNWFLLFCYLCATSAYWLIEKQGPIRHAMGSLSLPELALLLHMLWKNRRQKSYSEIPTLSLHKGGDVALSVVRNYSPPSRNKPDLRGDPGFCYIIGDDVISAVNRDIRKKLRAIKYNIFWSQSRLLSRLDSLSSEESLKIASKDKELIVERAKFDARAVLEMIRELQGIKFIEPSIPRIFFGAEAMLPEVKVL